MSNKKLRRKTARYCKTMWNLRHIKLVESIGVEVFASPKGQHQYIVGIGVMLDDVFRFYHRHQRIAKEGLPLCTK